VNRNEKSIDEIKKILKNMKRNSKKNEIILVSVPANILFLDPRKIYCQNGFIALYHHSIL